MPKPNESICSDDLRKRILSLDINPGSDIDEVSLSKEYGISRTPLREILHRLSGDGYVRLEENRRTDWNVEGDASTFASLIALRKLIKKRSLKHVVSFHSNKIHNIYDVLERIDAELIN